MKVLVVTAMYPTPQNPAFGSFVETQVEALRTAGVDVHVHVLQGRVRKLIYPKGVFQLRRYLARQRVDVVHAHFSYVGFVARLQRRAALVVTYHGDDLLGTVADESGRHTRLSPWIVRAGRWLARHVDAAIVQSDEMAARLDPGTPVHVAPHEIDFDTFRAVPRDQARRELGLEPARPYLLFAAHPATQVKRYSFARQVHEALRTVVPGAELLVAYREPQRRLALYMNACDALLFTSFQEGSPNVVKQAMACNLPVVSTDVGDVRQVIGNTRGCHRWISSVQVIV
jgi:teichuronic acid biosynthesis glycosyltransferase TuaC